MAVAYNIQADIVDITTDTPRKEDSFVVDTNVWYWMTYSKASMGAQPYQIKHYPVYTSDALGVGSTIYQSGLSLAELTHLIEKAERDIYAAKNPKITTKTYRHNLPAERSRVCLEVQAACSQVLSLSSSLNLNIDAALSTSAINRFSNEKVDGYDLFILESMAANGVIQIVTDDGDFTTVPGIRVFTANKNVLAAAKAQGRLVVR
ncbi:PIN domain-containing protein [Pseudomonas fluorescens]|uniref:PIN domain-containing protein n=1 Tax=Pseudomonas fluorescens TaxID=294 RepID=A0A7Z6N2L7_PSEFL|nr:PIN domain-containing protein [Pseudomonas fluorescens]RDS92595.1 PIN domain-containing protein [Pseudomonas fluorescens]